METFRYNYNERDKLQFIQLSVIDDSVLELKISDEPNKNTLHHALVNELIIVLYKIHHDMTLKVLVLKGLDDVFCAGADYQTLADLCQGKVKPVDILISKLLLDLPMPVIAAMKGHAIGGGLALGLCADMPIISQENRYGCSFMNMGFTPGMGITRLLETVFMPPLAHELQYTGELKKGREFIGKSGFTAILKKEDVEDYADNLALKIAEKPAHILQLLKRYLSMNKRKLFEETFTLETMMHEISFLQDDVKKRILENYVK